VFLPDVEGAYTRYYKPGKPTHFTAKLQYYCGVKMPTLVKAGKVLVAFTELRSLVGDAPLVDNFVFGEMQPNLLWIPQNAGHWSEG
jgi:hypothetical protein